ncbi:hypothetical protein [Endozoicomonas ascidiicola]|uniref:hypothetical protein n=1 Tax=Endozoicomonas ascidiicola TaxID=1698521 RepID=UPI000836ECE3|nr:hypothetical protein [Endozoicomonas ascidiicola]
MSIGTNPCAVQQTSAQHLQHSAQKSSVNEGVTANGAAVKGQPDAQPQLAAPANQSQASGTNQPTNKSVAERQASKATNGDNPASVKQGEQTDSTSSEAEGASNTSISSGLSNIGRHFWSGLVGHESLLNNVDEAPVETPKDNPKSETPSKAGQPSASATATGADKPTPQASLAGTDKPKETPPPASSAGAGKPGGTSAQASSEGVVDHSTTQNNIDRVLARLEEVMSSQAELESSLRSTTLEPTPNSLDSQSLKANEQLQSQYEESQAKLTEVTAALARSVGALEKNHGAVADLQSEVSEIKSRDGQLLDLVRESAEDGTRRAERHADQERNTNKALLSRLEELE